MKEQEILENNKLIDQFMTSRTPIEFEEGLYMGRLRGSSPKYYNYYDTIAIKDLQYHTSWDWLMPVVEKIEAMGWDTDICFNSNLHACIITKKGEEWGIDIIDDTKLSATYQAVVGFIKQVTTP